MRAFFDTRNNLGQPKEGTNYDFSKFSIIMMKLKSTKPASSNNYKNLFIMTDLQSVSSSIRKCCDSDKLDGRILIDYLTLVTQISVRLSNKKSGQL